MLRTSLTTTACFYSNIFFLRREYLKNVDPKKAPHTPTKRSVSRTGVIELARKISVSGTRKFPAPIKDEGNNPLLDEEGSPILRSPKKKYVCGWL